MLDHPGSRDDIGQDERGLVQLPFACLANWTNQKVMKVEWIGKDFRKRNKRFYRTIEGGADSGLPVYAAEVVFVGLMYWAQRAGIDERMTEFSVSRPELLATIGWDATGENYDRLELSLDQLAGVRIKTNALWDQGMGRHIEINMGIIQTWKWVENDDGRSKGDIRVRWNQDFITYLGRARFKLLNVRIFRSLKTNLAKRLYRWLDDAIYPSGRTEIDVLRLAHVKLGMSANTAKYPSQVLQRLKPALEELRNAGVCYWDYVNSSTTPSKKKFVFTRATRPSAKGADPAQSELFSPSIAQRLGDLSPTDDEIREAEQYVVANLDKANKRAYHSEEGPGLSTRMLVDSLILDYISAKRRADA